MFYTRQSWFILSSFTHTETFLSFWISLTVDHNRSSQSNAPPCQCIPLFFCWLFLLVFLDRWGCSLITTSKWRLCSDRYVLGSHSTRAPSTDQDRSLFERALFKTLWLFYRTCFSWFHLTWHLFDFIHLMCSLCPLLTWQIGFGHLQCQHQPFHHLRDEMMEVRWSNRAMAVDAWIPLHLQLVTSHPSWVLKVRKVFSFLTLYNLHESH